MTQEEKAKAYDEALERAKNFIENGDNGEKTVAESIFQGLIEESDEEEDEKVINWLIQQFDFLHPHKDGYYYTKVRPWLERHKENPIEAAAKKVTKDKKTAMAFLKSAGIMDENGNLAEMYRSYDENDDIRKGLIEFLSCSLYVQDSGLDDEKIKTWIEWLKKNHYSEEDMDKAYKNSDTVQYQNGFEAGIASVNPRKWADDEIENLNCIEACLKMVTRDYPLEPEDTPNLDMVSRAISWIINLRSKYKPSEEETYPEELDETYPEELDEAIKLYYQTYGNGRCGFDHLSLAKFDDIVKTFVTDYGSKNSNMELTKDEVRVLKDVRSYVAPLSGYWQKTLDNIINRLDINQYGKQ